MSGKILVADAVQSVMSIFFVTPTSKLEIELSQVLSFWVIWKCDDDFY